MFDTITEYRLPAEFFTTVALTDAAEMNRDTLAPFAVVVAGATY
jgi:hypothetical protein